MNGSTNSDNEVEEGDDEKEFEDKRDHLDYEPAPPGHMMMPPHAPIVHHHSQHGPRAPYAPPPPGYCGHDPFVQDGKFEPLFPCPDIPVPKA